MTRTCRRPFFSLALLLLATTSVACVKRAEIEVLKAEQKALTERIAKLERSPAVVGAELPQGAADKAPAEPRAKAAPKPATPDPQAVYAVPVGTSSVRGARDAWVTVVMFSDYQCPFCARADETMAALSKHYAKEARFVVKHNPLPFHPRAMPAAMAAECAGKQNQFWAVHDGLMGSHGRLDDGDIEKIAEKAKLNMAAWKKCLAQAEPKNDIISDQQLSTALGARGTPAFFINGRFINGAQPQPVFEALIEEELKKARASGIKAADYYAKAVEGAGRKGV